jgi:hypothetical protein
VSLSLLLILVMKLPATLNTRSLSMLAAGMLDRAVNNCCSLVVSSPVLAARAISSAMWASLEGFTCNEIFHFIIFLVLFVFSLN